MENMICVRKFFFNLFFLCIFMPHRVSIAYWRWMVVLYYEVNLVLFVPFFCWFVLKKNSSPFFSYAK